MRVRRDKYSPYGHSSKIKFKSSLMTGFNSTIRPIKSDLLNVSNGWGRQSRQKKVKINSNISIFNTSSEAIINNDEEVITGSSSLVDKG
jgi:hypothetical protein